MENIYIHLDSGKNDIWEAGAPMTYDANDAAKLQDYLDKTISPPYGLTEQIHPTEESLSQAHELQKEVARKLLAMEWPNRSDVGE